MVFTEVFNIAARRPVFLKRNSVIAAVTLLGALPSTAATVVRPVSVSLSGADEFFPAENIINGSGLEVPLNTGDPLPANVLHSFVAGGATDNWATTDPGGFPTDWFASSGTTPRFIFDLGQNVQLSTIHLWQYGFGFGGDFFTGLVQGNDARTLQFRFNLTGEGTLDFAGPAIEVTMDHSPVAGSGFAIPRQDFEIGGVVSARYVEMLITDNWFVAPGDGTGIDIHGHMVRGGDRVGLGEVRFSLVPEPGSFVLMLFGMSLLGWRRIRPCL